ncbi:hypothetical protein [Streptomyces angustmyceticus]|uniref:hypothetical protein n=1 Tax=Streptomyces angustmyceticus TaxID=285578 RepID=UPI0021AF0513|nr:hypothetical protein [Streptomyces angustmyceticus]
MCVGFLRAEQALSEGYGCAGATAIKRKVGQSRQMSDVTAADELEGLAVDGQIPQAEHKARLAALEEGIDEGAGQ